MEVLKVGGGGGYGCGYQYEDDKMVTKASFRVLTRLLKRGNAFQGPLKVRSGNGGGSVPKI